MERPVKIGSGGGAGAGDVAALAQSFDVLTANMGRLGGITPVLSMSSLAVGYFVPRLFRVSHASRSTRRWRSHPQLHAGHHRRRLGVGNEVMAVPAAVYGVLMFVPAGTVAYLLSRRAEPTASPPPCRSWPGPRQKRRRRPGRRAPAGPFAAVASVPRDMHDPKTPDPRSRSSPAGALPGELELNTRNAEVKQPCRLRQRPGPRKGQITKAPIAGCSSPAGADVIKVGRRAVSRCGSAPHDLVESHEFVMLNSNKRSVVLDLKTDAGRQALLALVETADVLIETSLTGHHGAPAAQPGASPGAQPKPGRGLRQGYGSSGP